MKKLLFATLILLTFNSFSADLQCVDVDGKSYPLNAETSKFIKAVVNRNAVSCESPTVILAAKLSNRKIITTIATDAQANAVRKMIADKKTASITKKLKKAGY